MLGKRTFPKAQPWLQSYHVISYIWLVLKVGTMNAADFPSAVIFPVNPDTVMITKGGGFSTKIMLVINLELKQSVVPERLSFKPESEITWFHIPCLKKSLQSLSRLSPLILLSASNASCLVTFRMPSLYFKYYGNGSCLMSVCFHYASESFQVHLQPFLCTWPKITVGTANGPCLQTLQTLSVLSISIPNYRKSKQWLKDWIFFMTSLSLLLI